MNRIPKDLDLSKAIGEVTTQVHVGKYDIQLNFGDVHFAIQSKITLRKNGVVFAVWEEGTWPESGFVEIFNVAICKIDVPDETSIIIEFENGLEMHLIDDSDQYESMSISIKGGPGPWLI